MFLSENFKPSEIEEKVLEFWEKNRVFQKSLDKTKGGQPFTFYDGPPFATGLPHYGHILASTIKDVIPRYQTMKGRFVRRRWGWDCHGLPIEEIVERHLGISGKKQIEELGIEKFNKTCREKVLEYADEWGKTVRRIARWIDFDNSYKTMDRDYMESVWWAFKQIYDKGLVYEGRKVLMYCPRCETPVSNFEVAMDNSYQEDEEMMLTVKFRLEPGQKIGGRKIKGDTYILAWTTTPWTLPGNVALAVGKDIEYAFFEDGSRPGETFILARQRAASFGLSDALRPFRGEELAGLSYRPLFDVPAVKNDKTFKVYAADFVSTEEGTGIVHTAVVYGEEDYELGQKVGLPVVPLLDEKGKFNDKAPEFLRGKYFKEADAVIIADLEKQGLLLRKEKMTHSYPHCWRCGTPLFYNAIPAWFINISKIKDQILKSNEKEISWYPPHLKFGRYAKSVESAPDWNISRNRYWGNPIPVWKCDKGCPPVVVGSIKELGLSRNTFYFTRHGEAESNVLGINSCYPETRKIDLTAAGVERAKKMAEKLSAMGSIDLIVSSDLLRTKHTAEIVGQALGVPVMLDERLREYRVGVFNGKPVEEFRAAFPESKRWLSAPEGGETWTELQKRIVAAIEDINQKNEGKKILIVSHGDALWMVQKYYGSERPYPTYADPFEIEVSVPDLHRPYIDEVVLKCPRCGGEARRIKEIFDSWMEAGSMPFAEYHYPFDQKEVFESRLPAQFVAEYIAQTRAWFYLMHVVSYILFNKAPFENVVTTGTILADDGSKMSKSKGNYPDPGEVMDKYGVDALRFYLMNSSVMQADNLNFSVRDLEIAYRRVVVLLWNVYNYYATYAGHHNYKPSLDGIGEPRQILDRWIWAKTQELVNLVSEGLDKYDTVRATRTIAAYIEDLSTWYLRRSRGRKDADFFGTLRHALLALSKVMAPVMPYISEAIYQGIGYGVSGMGEESVHLTDWPLDTTRGKPEDWELGQDEKNLLRDMAVIREAASLGQAARKELNIPVRQPLPRLAFFTREEMTPSAELMQVLLEELNVKKFDPGLSAEKSKTIKVLPGTAAILNLYLDTSISEDLRLEGLVRALERAIQELRKKQGLKVGELAVLSYATEDSELKKALELFDRKKTFISAIKEGAEGEEMKLNGKSVKLTVVKA